MITLLSILQATECGAMNKNTSRGAALAVENIMPIIIMSWAAFHGAY
jgi:hypothetical protein